MISLTGKVKVLEKLAIDNSPVLLTAIGVAGTIGTAVLTHRAATKAEVWRRNELQQRDDLAVAVKSVPAEITKREHFDANWKLYIPPVVSGIATVGAVVMANHIGTKRAAALAAAYTVTEKAYTEYREKVVERLGEKDEANMRNEIVQKKVSENPPTEGNTLVLSGSSDHLFCEIYTRRYFRSDMQTIRKAVNDINHQILTEGHASISDFYDLIGLERTQTSDEMGWTPDKLMDVDFDAVLAEDGQPCVGISFLTVPVRYSQFR